MSRFTGLAARVVLAATVLTAAALVWPGAVIAQGDLDLFMQQVLARRDENWKKLQQYVLDERAQMEVRALGNVPIWGEVRDYAWYLRDGFFVRSPVRANGVLVPESDRRKYETEYLRRTQERDRRAGRGRPDGEIATAGTIDAGDANGLIRQTRQPDFIDSAYFLKFKFEASKYALVGHDTFEGRDVLQIEYYPSRLFSHEQEMQQRRAELSETDRRRDQRAAVERMMNKVSLVTMWVEPASHQIVKYTFDNVNLDFLPAAWLIHMDAAKAVMTMSQPIPDVWLPRDIDLLVSATLAAGSFDARARVNYTNYRRADTDSRFRVTGQ